ncbi:hypothetical protein [Bradyrhizobium liaoningense]|uniref:hypothetical protein n=1 Tax=Bradyrhizobium liaoningense TaxID=43992 RepID=UPI001BA8177E|nr:hypothetical protein [Bradyrhizobium liaoningense]MBR0714914.1 hypothetical protein [Bradyrhizobium liaoningense]
MHQQQFVQQQFEQMSIDELWVLHRQVESVLEERLIAKKHQLEKQLEQLRQRGVNDSRSGN